MIILGINAYHAEASAALLRDGELVAAAEEERFCRIKHVAGFPTQAVRYCLSEAGARLDQVDAIALSRNPWSHLWAKACLALGRGPSSAGIRDRLSVLDRIRHLRETLCESLDADPKTLKARLHFVEHHRAHISSSFYPSGWEGATLLSLDGFGDLMSGLWGIGRGNRLGIEGGAPFPHSLGILYTALTQFLGFLQWGDEYKVMGLAAYGDPARYRAEMSRLAEEARNGYRLHLRYFRHHHAEGSMTWTAGAPSLAPLFSKRMEMLFGPARAPAEVLEQRHSDIAAALQERLEAVVLKLLQRLADRHRTSRLCYAGGVALNCLLNGKIRRETPFRQIFIQPAAHDAGTSLGAALYVAHAVYDQPRRLIMKHAAWGPSLQEADCRQALQGAGLRFREMEDEEALCGTAAQALAQGKILGWFQGRMEFGPRSLGHRSLLADPRDPKMKDRINEKVKRRESFRPFAPSLPAESVHVFFPEGHPDRFMLFAYPVSEEKRGLIPSALHRDGTGRLQAVEKDSEPLFWKLLKRFEQASGVPVLLNTSFNEQEPIVCRPQEALSCFQRNGIDCLALGPYWIEREQRS